MCENQPIDNVANVVFLLTHHLSVEIKNTKINSLFVISN